VDDLYNVKHDRSERSFHYPLYERWLFVVGIIVGVTSVFVRERLGEFIQDSKPKGLAIVAVIAVFVLGTFWVSFRGWQSKILVTHKSIKAWYFWQGFSRISWQHIKEVYYSWRPLGHKLTFEGSDGAMVAFRSSIQNYDHLMEYIRANAPQRIVEELDEIFGEYEDEEDENERDDVEDEELDDEEPDDEPEEEDKD
jgi:hypothetical protein